MQSDNLEREQRYWTNETGVSHVVADVSPAGGLFSHVVETDCGLVYRTQSPGTTIDENGQLAVPDPHRCGNCDWGDL